MPIVALARPEKNDQQLLSRTLDVFKGLAAVAMVINHSGYALLTNRDANSGWLGLTVFLGSFAPALFFFATGFGAGLRPIGKPVDWTSIWKKSAWLILADQLLIWSGGHSFGMDFFGFIALSVVSMALIQGRRRSNALCIGLIVFLLLIRYPARALIEGVAGHDGFCLWLSGLQGQDGWSYPLSPWLVAPLAGFLSARNAPLVADNWRKLLAVAVVVTGSLISLILYSKGASFFRWGSVSAAYFVAGVTAVTIAWAIAGWLVRLNSRLEGPLSLRGASVFLVVPIHYGALAIVKALDPQTLTSSNWILGLAGMLILTGLALTLARHLADILRSSSVQVNGALRTVLLCAIIVLAWWSPAFTLVSALACAAAQCMIAARLTR